MTMLENSGDIDTIRVAYMGYKQMMKKFAEQTKLVAVKEYINDDERNSWKFFESYAKPEVTQKCGNRATGVFDLSRTGIYNFVCNYTFKIAFYLFINILKMKSIRRVNYSFENFVDMEIEIEV